MSTASITINNGSGVEVRTEINEALLALASDFIGGIAPFPTYAGMTWIDTSGNDPVKKQRDPSNSAWVTLGTFIKDELNVYTYRIENALREDDNTVTKQGNDFNGNSQLIKTTVDGKYPAMDGSKITNLTIVDPLVTIKPFGIISSGNVILDKDRPHTITISGVINFVLPTDLTEGTLYNCSILANVLATFEPTYSSPIIWAFKMKPLLTNVATPYRITFETWDAGETWFGYWTQLVAG